MTEKEIQNFHNHTNLNLLALYNNSLDGEMINFARNHSIDSSSLYEHEDVFEGFSERYYKYIESGMNTIEDIIEQEFYRYLYSSDIIDAYVDGREDLIINYINDTNSVLEESHSSQFLKKILLRLSLSAMINQQSYKIFASIPIQYLLGEKGLISLLKENGYIVEKLFQTQLR